MRKRIVVEIEFDEATDEYDGETKFLEFHSMRVVEDQTDVSVEERGSLTEAWGQSDWYSIGFVSEFLSMLDGDEVTAEDVNPY